MTDYASLGDADLAAEWKRVGLDVPQPLVAETVGRGARMVPHLGPMMTDPAIWEAPDPEGWAGPHAVMLLETIASPDAAPYVLEFLRQDLGDDWLTEEGHNLVFSLGPSGAGPVWTLVGDESADVWVRIESVIGLTMIALANEPDRVVTAARLRAVALRTLARPEPAADDFVLMTWLCYSLADLHDEESRPLILGAIAAKRCDWDADDVPQAYETSFEKILDRWRNDPLEHFAPENLHHLREGPYDEESDEPEESEPGEEPIAPFVREAAKVGRNDPCPCGSGKKHKKCCGK